MRKNELTKIQRQILYNQYEILSKLIPDNEDEISKILTILANGYSSRYNDVFTVCDEEEELSLEDCDFVYDVLNMYSALHFSYEKLKDKTDIEKYKIIFKGFDGNYEVGLLSFARFLIKDEGRFGELDNGDLDSHAHRIELYSKMLKSFSKIEIEHRHSMSKEQILSVINT